MLNVQHFRELVVRPALMQFDAWSQAAENLVLGTAIQESDLMSLAQEPAGPGLGLFQMEPATHIDIWNNYISYREGLQKRLGALGYGQPNEDRLVWDMRYGAIMCRIHYLRVPETLPADDDIDDLARYWKEHYNTYVGKGTPAEFALKYRTYVKE